MAHKIADAQTSESLELQQVLEPRCCADLTYIYGARVKSHCFTFEVLHSNSLEHESGTHSFRHTPPTMHLHSFFNRPKSNGAQEPKQTQPNRSWVGLFRA